MMAPRVPLLERAYQLHERAATCLGRGELGTAERLAARALAVLDRQLGPRSPDVAGACQTLGTILLTRGKYREAATAARRAVAILARVPAGDEDADVLLLRSRMLLACVDRDRGQYARAQQRLRRAIDEGRRRLGARHVEVAEARVALGSVHKFRGDHAAAARCYRRARIVLVAALGADHPALAPLYHNLGGLEHARGRHRRAEPWARRSLALAERAHGPGHPQVAAELAALAAVLDGMRRFDESEPLYRRALAIFRRVHGPRHYEVGINLNNLGAVYAATGRTGRAGRTYLAAIDTLTAAVGPRHPDVGLAIHNLAVLREQGGDPAARRLFRRARSIFRATLGPAHDYTRAAASACAAPLPAQGG